MERTLADGGLDWTVLRPARLSDGPHAGKYRYVLDYSKPGSFGVSRADPADAMLRLLDEPESIRRYVRFV